MATKRKSNIPPTAANNTPVGIGAAPTLLPSLDPKAQLEIEKLQEELINIRNARNWWPNSFKRVKPNEWIIAAAAVCALLTAFYTGIFDATRQNLAAQQEHLLTEKALLEQRKDKLTTEVALKTADLEELKKRLSPFENEQAAVQDLRQMKTREIQAAFSVTPEFDGFKISLQNSDQIAWSTIPTTKTNPYLSESLRAVNRLRSVKGLRIIDLTITADEAALATQRSEIETLILLRGDIETKTLSGLRPLPNLQTFDLSSNKLTSLDGCPAYPSVISLTLDGNPIGDDALASIPKLFPNLHSISLAGTNVPDNGMKNIAKLRNLSGITLEGSKVTGEGILTLLDCPKLMVVEIAKEMISDPEREALKQKRPTDLVLVHLTAEQRVFRAIGSVNQW